MSEEKTPKKRQGGPMGGPMGGMSLEKPKSFKAGIGKLLRYLKAYSFAVALGVLFTSAGTVLSILAPSYVKEITAVIYGAAGMHAPIDMSKIAEFGLILIIFYGLNAVFHYLNGFIFAGVNAGVSRRLRRDISRKINKVPLRYFDGHNVGNTLSRVTNDVDTIGQTLNQSVNQFVYAVVSLIGVMIAMFISCWQLALTALITVPVGFSLMMVFIKLSQKHFRAQQNHLGELNGHIEEIYSGQVVVKAFNGERRAAETFDKTNEKLFSSAVKSQFLSGMMMPLMNFVANLGLVAVCAVGGAMLVTADPAAHAEWFGTISAFLIYVRLFQNPMGAIAQSLNALQGAAAASERVFEFLEEEEQPAESGKLSAPASVKGLVEFKNVRFGYDKAKPVIKDFSALVMPGQKVAIVGPTGAGKTTMVNLLMRFYEADDGDILIDGVPTTSMRREDVRAMFGMVLQDTWLFEGTIRENIVYSKDGVSDDEVVAAAKAANIDHFIRTLSGGYDMKLSDDVSISGGQRQLLTIARATVQNSPMLILDEATSNVDTRTEQLIQDAMDKITRGRTSFVIAHRLSTIKNADLILVMKDGDIIESGRHEELLARNGFYSGLYNSQFALE